MACAYRVARRVRGNRDPTLRAVLAWHGDAHDLALPGVAVHRLAARAAHESALDGLDAGTLRGVHQARFLYALCLRLPADRPLPLPSPAAPRPRRACNRLLCGDLRLHDALGLLVSAL